MPDTWCILSRLLYGHHKLLKIGGGRYCLGFGAEGLPQGGCLWGQCFELTTQPIGKIQNKQLTVLENSAIIGSQKSTKTRARGCNLEVWEWKNIWGQSGGEGYKWFRSINTAGDILFKWTERAALKSKAHIEIHKTAPIAKALASKHVKHSGQLGSKSLSQIY